MVKNSKTKILKPPDPGTWDDPSRMQKTGGIRSKKMHASIHDMELGVTLNQHPEQSRKRHKPYKVGLWKI